MAPNCCTPTLAQSTSHPPSVDCTCRAASATDALSPTSARAEVAGTPNSSEIAFAVASADVASMSSAATAIPTAAKVRPSAAPSPPPPPVTTAILPPSSHSRPAHSSIDLPSSARVEPPDPKQKI